MAGKAHEWLLELKDDMFNTPAALQQVLWERGSVVGNAVKSQEWHRRARASPRSVDLINADFFDAIPYGIVSVQCEKLGFRSSYLKETLSR
jgi:hypothetical protein